MTTFEKRLGVMKHSFLLSVLLCGLVSCGPGRQTIHVSPDGDDRASGSLRHPLMSLDEALKRARTVEGEKTVLLGEGVWRILHPVELGVGDSGVRIIGKGMGKTVISGGVEIPAFSVFSKDGDKEIWSVTLPEGIDFQQLYVDGERAVPAAPERRLTGKVTETIEGGSASFVMELDPEVGKILAPVGRKPSQMRVNICHKWDQTIRCVDSISVDGSKLYFRGSPQIAWKHLDDNSQFTLEDDIVFLDRCGEWFFDRTCRILYYIPKPGQTPENTRAVVPVAGKLLRVRGNSGEHAAGISLEGVTLEHTSYLIGPEGREPAQAGGESDAAVEVDFADGFRMENCEIAHTGNNGVWIREACRDCELVHCRIHDLGIGGVKIGAFRKPDDEDLLLTRNVRVDNCIIQGGSRVIAPGTGLLLFNASDCSITHNDIADFVYTGISVGWNWGYSPSPSKRNDISYNHVHHLGWRLLSDMGGIYTLGLSEGTAVTHNHIHHICSFGYGGWGMYPDEGSTGILWECNLVHDCKSAGFHLHYGRDNVVRNNLFVNQVNEQLAATRIEDHTSFVFESNVVAYTRGDMYSHKWPMFSSVVRNNLYWKFGGEVSFNGLSLEEWKRETGKDEGSIVADPGFRNLPGGDFTMTGKAALEAVGFTCFDWTEAGVYGSEEWKKLAELDESRLKAFPL